MEEKKTKSCPLLGLYIATVRALLRSITGPCPDFPSGVSLRRNAEWMPWTW